MEVGDVVRLHGLEKASLNGLLAVVQAQHSDERWVLQPMGGGASNHLAVRKQNLRLARSIPDTLGYGLVLASLLSVLLVAAALQSELFSKLRALVPMTSLLWYLTTLMMCYWIHAPLLADSWLLNKSGQGPIQETRAKKDGVLVPAISEMGISSSGRSMYRVGFGFCGFMLAITMIEVYALFKKFHPESDVNAGFYSGLLAAAGIALQGLCTLRLNFGLETMAHFFGAMLTMLGAMSHANSCNEWFEALPKTSPLLRRGWQSWGWRLRREMMRQAGGPGPLVIRLQDEAVVPAIGGPGNEVICEVLFMIPLLLQAGKRVGFFTELNILENCMGIMQWALVACIGLFFFSYACDLC